MRVSVVVLLLAAVSACAAVHAERGSMYRARKGVPKTPVVEKPVLLPNITSIPREQLLRMSPEEIATIIHGPVRKPDAQYWWNFTNSDCAYDDVAGSCQGQTVEECKATCLKTDGCGGFNYPHGILKKTDCLQHITSSTVDLYIVQDKPQPPPPPPPPPSVNFPPIWPHPQKFTNGTTAIYLSPTFKFTTTSSSPDLPRAFARYTNLILQHTNTAAPPSGSIVEVKVSVANDTGVIQLYTDESYTLDIQTDGTASITAPTVFGAMYGMETFSQLVRFDFDARLYTIAAAPWTITDSPRFPHREVLLDTSRHFQPLQSLRNVIEALPYTKINVVHWHLVDQQSFPFDSPSHPKLSQAGAYSEYERYTVQDVADMVEFARQRGVRMMVEIDTPGHAACWCDGYPEICPSTTCTEPLNPATNATFDLISGLFQDLTGGQRGAGLFPENLMHLGGDEVNTNCWTTTPAVADWLKEHNFTADDGYKYFVNRVQTIAHGMGRDVVGWEEIWDHFHTALDKSTIIHQWLPGSTIAKDAIAAGYRVLWSTDGDWYLDGLGTTWQKMYEQEPCTGIPDEGCNTLMLGGGGCMWGETVDTSDIQQTIFPRLAAIAERLWSPRTLTDSASAAKRYSAFRCLLNRRGVAAAPSMNTEARSAPKGPGGCYDQ